MGAKITIVNSTRVQNFFRRIKTLVHGKDDVKTPYESAPFGYDANPPPGLRAIYMETGRKGKDVIIGYLNDKQAEEIAQGEVRLYSLTTDGQLSQFIRLLNNGMMHIAGEDDNMVRYIPLETAVNELNDKLNDLVSAFNAHTHDGVIVSVSGGSGSPAVGVPGSSGTPDNQTADPSTADITPAKIEEIKTKGV